MSVVTHTTEITTILHRANKLWSRFQISIVNKDIGTYVFFTYLCQESKEGKFGGKFVLLGG